LIGSKPGSTRDAADDAVRALDWEKQYFCDADHITFETVDRFLKTCDFYTIDVADSIGQLTTPVNLEAFVERHRELLCARPATPRRPASGSELSSTVLYRHVIFCDPGKSIGCLHPVPSPTTLAFDNW
jgi:hypothetical protein